MMERLKELIELCRQDVEEKMTTNILYANTYRDIIKMAEKLNVIGIYDNKDLVKIQLNDLQYLLEIDKNPEVTFRKSSLGDITLVTYSTVKDGIEFFVLITEEEHKKAQAI